MYHSRRPRRGNGKKKKEKTHFLLGMFTLPNHKERPDTMSLCPILQNKMVINLLKLHVFQWPLKFRHFGLSQSQSSPKNKPEGSPWLTVPTPFHWTGSRGSVRIILSLLLPLQKDKLSSLSNYFLKSHQDLSMHKHKYKTVLLTLTQIVGVLVLFLSKHNILFPLQSRIWKMKKSLKLHGTQFSHTFIDFME